MAPLFSRFKSLSNQDRHENAERKRMEKGATSPLSKSCSMADSSGLDTVNQLHMSKSASMTDTTSSHSGPSALRPRLVKRDDVEIAAMAIDTKILIDWQSVMLSARVGPARWRLKDVVDKFAIYTRQESQRFGVLAVGVVPGCAAEIVNVLQSRNSAQYEQSMAAIFEDQFKDGSFVHSVDVSNEFLPGRQSTRDNAELTELTVKTLTFNKSGWLSSHEEWCYVDAVYRNQSSGVVEKHMTSMSPSDIVAGLSGRNTKYVQNVTCSYLLRPGSTDEPLMNRKSNQDEPLASNDKQRATRVTFYSEYIIPKQVRLLSKTGSRNPDIALVASEKAVKQRLLKLAESTSRLVVLVRRQRLGLQVLVDTNRFLPPTNSPCTVCTKMLTVAKLCRLCGHGVCGDCSSKHERAHQPRGSDTIRVTQVRVCARCLERVDHATYSNLVSSSLLGPQLVPDQSSSTEPASLLKDALQGALESASSPARKSCVKSVIKCLLDQDYVDSNQTDDDHNSMPPVLLSSSSSEEEYIQALDYLEVERVACSSPELRTDENRQYVYDSNSDLQTDVGIPLPSNEAARLRAVEKLSISQLSESTELEILCHVISSEMGCATIAIAIIDSDTYRVIATNNEGRRNATLPRYGSMCSHTILENRPLIVRHPESDIRFSTKPILDELNLRYYCAYPITGEDDQIVGTICCINDTAVDVSESQFSVFKKLAMTASKIVRVHSTQRQRGSSTSSSGSSHNGNSSRASVA